MFLNLCSCENRNDLIHPV